MTPVATPTLPASTNGAPAWEVALLFPPQGHWTEADYLTLDTNHLVELCDGRLEVLPMPMPLHQFIVGFLYTLLLPFVGPRKLGQVLLAPLPIRLGADHLREPDVMFFRTGRIKNLRQPPDGADLVMEVVSPGAENRRRDREVKRREYAAAGIAEYWIVDPEEARILVLTLDGNSYREHGSFGPGETATSVLLPGLAVPVADVFASGME